MCSGEYKCKVPVSPGFLEQKGNYICPGVKKYLMVTYACHQNPRLHMVCKNCTSKCWPLCTKDCCHPPPPTSPPTVAIIKQAPKILTCPNGCPAHCAPNCQLSCCVSNSLGLAPPKNKHEISSTCNGNCKNLCGPLCLPSCCNKNKKSAPAPLKTLSRINKLPKRKFASIATCPVASCPMNCRPLCQAACCKPKTPNKAHSEYVEPLSARLQQLTPNYAQPPRQCINGCDPTCAPSCDPQCCAYMGELRALGGPSVPQQFQTPLRTMVLPNEPALAQARAPVPVQQPQIQAMARPPVASPIQGYPGYATPQAFFNTQQAPYPVINQAPTNLVTSQTLDVEEPNHTYQQVNPVARGCPPQCATTCDATCRLDCCADPSSYVFTTNSVGDDSQRKTYERLLEKYRTEQLARYYQTRGFTG